MSLPRKGMTKYIINHQEYRNGKVYRSPEYQSWLNMITRCYFPAKTHYRYYGGRGIKVCEHWWDFANFLHDMGPRPDGTSIDRIDVDKDYMLANCKWSTHQEQSINRQFYNKHSQYFGVTWSKSNRKWQAQICSKNNYQFLGYYKTEIEAAQAYDKEVINHHGKFARRNFNE